MIHTIGTTKITVAGNEIDFGDENWERINYIERMRELLGFDFLEIDDYKVLQEKIKNFLDIRGIFYIIIRLAFCGHILALITE